MSSLPSATSLLPYTRTHTQLIIPLGLYVAPSFFNPERALKTHLLNVFKKTLTPNIMSEKVRPPHIGKPPPAPAPAPAPTRAPVILTSIASISVDTSTAASVMLVAANVVSASANSSAAPTGASSAGLSVARHGKHARHRSLINFASSSSSDQVDRTDKSDHPAMPSPTPAPSSATPHSRSVSRTINAFAKAVTGLTSSSTAATPTQAAYSDTATIPLTPGSASGSGAVHKFGTKAPTFGRSGSRARTPTTSSIITPPQPNPTDDSNIVASRGAASGAEDGQTQRQKDKEKKEKGKTRSRAASLFSRSRPFTPPVNITALHPVPALSPTPTPLPALASAGNASTSNLVGQALLPPSQGNQTSLSLPLPLQGYRGSRGRPMTSPSPTPSAYSPASSRGPSPSSSPSPTPSLLNGAQPSSYRPHATHLHPFYQHAPPPPPAFGQTHLNQHHEVATTFVHSSNASISTTQALSRSASTSSRAPSRPILLTPSRPTFGFKSNSGGTYDESGETDHAPAGLTPAPRKRPGMRKRPSTAEPRLGMR